MGRSNGVPVIVKSSHDAQHEQLRWMMEQQQAMQADQNYVSYMNAMNSLNIAQPRDIYIAGQVIDGLTGEIKRVSA